MHPIESDILHRTATLITHFEGCRLTMYKCAGARPTIGYGHQIKPGEGISDTITQAQAERLLQQDVEVRQQVNRDAHEEVPEAFMRWVRAGGRIQPGLIHRRKEEGEIYRLRTFPPV